MVAADEEKALHQNRDAAGVGGGGVGPDDQAPLLFEEHRRQRGRLEHKEPAAILEIDEGEGLLEKQNDLARAVLNV